MRKILVGLFVVAAAGAGILWAGVVEDEPLVLSPQQRRVQVIGHAGSGFFTPINPFNPLPPSSLRGIELALERGVDGIEVDIQLSKDSIPMLYHDVTLASMTDGTGCVSEHTAAEMTALHYRGGWPYDWWQQEQPVTVETLLVRLHQRAATRGEYPYLHLDLHEQNQCAPAGQQYARSPALVRALTALLRRYQVPAQKLLFVTDKVSTLPLLRRALPQAPLAVEITDHFEENLQVALRHRVQAVVVRKDMITPARSAAVRAAGLDVVLFGGRSAQSIRRLLSCYPTAIEVDNAPLLLQLLGRTPADEP